MNIFFDLFRFVLKLSIFSVSMIEKKIKEKEHA